MLPGSPGCCQIRAIYAFSLRYTFSILLSICSRLKLFHVKEYERRMNEKLYERYSASATISGNLRDRSYHVHFLLFLAQPLSIRSHKRSGQKSSSMKKLSKLLIIAILCFNVRCRSKMIKKQVFESKLFYLEPVY